MFGWWKSLTGLGQIVVVVGVVLVLFGLAKLMIWSIEDNARDAGEKTVIVETQKKVIEDVQSANEARAENARRDDDQRIADCVRRARNPEDCQ